MAEAFDIRALPEAKSERYARLAQEIAAVLDGEPDRTARMAGGNLGAVDEERAGSVLALAFPERVAKARGAEGHFLMANGRAAKLDAVEGLSRENYLVIADVAGGHFQAGFHVFGLESDGVGYAMDQYNGNLIPPDVITEVEEARKKIIAGQIKVTDAMLQ